MNLKTHTGYPDNHIDRQSFDWVSRILSLDGTVLATTKGGAKSNEDASSQIIEFIESVQDDFLIPEVETITADDVGDISELGL